MNNIETIDDLTSFEKLEDSLYYEEWKNMLAFSLDFPEVTITKSWLVASRFIKYLKEQGNIEDLIFMPCEDCFEWSPKTCKYISFLEDITNNKKSSPFHQIEMREELNQLKKDTSEVWDI